MQFPTTWHKPTLRRMLRQRDRYLHHFDKIKAMGGPWAFVIIFYSRGKVDCWDADDQRREIRRRLKHPDNK
jgi:hypothetical protein